MEALMAGRTQNFNEGATNYGNAFGRGYRPSKATAEANFVKSGGTIGRASADRSAPSTGPGEKRKINPLPGTKYYESDLIGASKFKKARIKRAVVKAGKK
jgi:hypothetical protein